MKTAAMESLHHQEPPGGLNSFAFTKVAITHLVQKFYIKTWKLGLSKLPLRIQCVGFGSDESVSTLMKLSTEHEIVAGLLENELQTRLRRVFSAYLE